MERKDFDLKNFFLLFFLSTIFLQLSFADNFLFNQKNSMQHLKYQCDLGPRIPGSEELKTLRNHIIDLAMEYQFAIEKDSFTYHDKIRDTEFPVVNILITNHHQHNPGILFMSHYDTRPWADQDPDPKNRKTPIIGANDGGSSTAVLMELMRVVYELKPDINIGFLFLDAEDYGTQQHLDQYCIGSQHIAKTLDFSPYQFGILIDLIGKCNSTYYFEGYSSQYAQFLNQIVWNKAAELGLNNFVFQKGTNIIDDHLYFLLQGFPVIDIIDLDYKYWHTVEDTYDKCCPESLYEIGILLESLIRDFNQ